MGSNVKRSMLIHLTVAPLIKRRSRLSVLLLAVAIGGAVVSALMGIYLELDANLSREFRRYGANVVVTPADGRQNVAVAKVDAAAGLLGDNVVGYSPYHLIPAETGGRRATVVGLRGDQIADLHPYWKWTGRAKPAVGGRFAYIGHEAARRFVVKPGDRLNLKAASEVSIRIDAVIESGGPEDNQIYVDPGTAAKLSGGSKRVDLAYLSIAGSWADIKPLARAAEKTLGVEITPLKQAVDSEAKVLGRIKSMFWLVTIVILATNVLCVATTMIASVMERRVEIGLKKALGAKNQDILVEFLIQGAAVGLVGGLAGWALGFVIAGRIGQTVFGAPVGFHWSALLLALAVSLMTAALATVVPTRMALSITPAVVLKGE